MKIRNKEFTIRVLQSVLGVVIFLESLIVVLNYREIIMTTHISLPSWTLLVLAGAEMIAAVLFLIPQTINTGTYSLLIIFLLAITIHILHGQYNVGALFIYGSAVFAVNSQTNRK